LKGTLINKEINKMMQSTNPPTWKFEFHRDEPNYFFWAISIQDRRQNVRWNYTNISFYLFS
jgi:hypothetical protein